MSVMHNHITRDIKSEGQCPACDEYHARQKAKDDNQMYAFNPEVINTMTPEKRVEFATMMMNNVLYFAEQKVILMKAVTEIYADGSYKDIASEIAHKAIQEINEQDVKSGRPIYGTKPNEPRR